MFKPNQFKVGNAICTVQPGWLAASKREISNEEIMESYPSTLRTHSSLFRAQLAASDFEVIALRKDTSGCAFMKFECPIFEINETKILYVHFQGKKFLINHVNCLEQKQSFGNS